MPTSQQCVGRRLGFHKWPKWSEPEQGDFMERLLSDNDNIPPEWKPRKLTIQHRTCTICGLYQFRQVRLTQEIYP